MVRIIMVLTFLGFILGCAGTPQYGGTQSVPVEGMTRVKVGNTSILIVPQKRVSNGVVFVMEDGKLYWSKRYIENDETLRLLENSQKIARWVHLSPVSEHQIKKGDVILTCKGNQLYFHRF